MVKIKKINFFQSKSISRKIITAIFLISSIVTLVITTIQLSFDYFQEMGILENTLAQVEKSYSKSIASSLWELHGMHMQTQLDGIVSIPGIQYAEILDGEKAIVRSGTFNNDKLIRKIIQLVHTGSNDVPTPIGTLAVYANADYVYQKIYKKVYLIFITQLFKTVLVSFFIYLSIQKILTGHLIHISQYLKSIKMDSSDKDLEINRRKKELNKDEESENLDELDSLVDSINEMRRKLTQSYKDVFNLNKELEKKVDMKTQQILEQRQKLEYASKMSTLGEMAGGIAHEINNPITIISSTNRIIRKLIEKGETSTDKLLKHCDSIDKTVTRITKITTGLRVVSRDASNEDFEVTNLGFIFNDVLALCSEKFKVNGVDILIDLDDDVYKTPLTCNRIQLSQVFLNLFGNAFDAVVGLPEKWVRVKCADDNDHVIIRFIDSGAGIDKSVQEKIFQPFFTTKEIGKGTGLGLSLANSIIKNHKGDIFVDDSIVNTCFVIVLPLHGVKNA